jgi:pimeloyl-ACP methyl ester carboxylesterase
VADPIPFYDFGGEGPLIHFAHANGYPPACYKRLIAPLLDDYHVTALSHRPLWPGSHPEELTTWHTIADDMIRFFDQEGMTNMVGIGHSLGAVVTMYAAHQRPSLFRALVLIEPVFLMPYILQMFGEMARDVLTANNPLISIASSRRNNWPNRQAAFDHYRPKRVFARWSDDTLWDYITHGMDKTDNGEIVLAYSPEWEAHIYSLPPTDVWQLIPQLKQPTLAIRGAETETLAPAAWQMWQLSQPQATFIELDEVGHMVPMEKPQEVADHITHFLSTIPP